MPGRPERPKVYHITHEKNLADIIASGGLLADGAMRQRGGPSQGIAMDRIKYRRSRLSVACNSGDVVADYVPFYFCPRSVMLFVIHKANNPELEYRDGQGRIVHLVADMIALVEKAAQVGGRWAISTRNAADALATFHSNLEARDSLEWDAIRSRDFRDRNVRTSKQAEFLVYDSVAWESIERIGVHSEKVRERVTAAIASADHMPVVETRPE